ncbi:MAG: hypothetical protein P1V51_16055 [Deltaproteobacteria bacterium]|nr:hypothetical protein [Deltaproteobacteria bacterium]
MSVRRPILALLVLAGLALAPASAAAQAVGPRPLHLTDLTPANVFSLGTSFARLGSDNGLVLPVGIDLRIAEEIAFVAELPFGYAGPSGSVAQPVLGNLAIGARGSRYVQMGLDGGFRYGAALRGRVPTAPGLGAEAASMRSASLRPVSFYRSERWSPGAAAVRLDLGLAFDLDPFAIDLEVGGSGILPIDDRPAVMALHYGLLFAAKAFKGMWTLVELAGADGAIGLPEDSRGHLLTISAGLRFEIGRFSPSAHVTFPITGELGGQQPIIFAIEMASF